MLDRRWLRLAAVGLVLLGLLVAVGSMFVDISFGTRDTRPLGSVDDIAALRERADLNVLFILVDTLRADHLSSYGYTRDTSPRLDGLAASGVRFARQLSQSSWTKASMASLWTGLHPVRTGVTRFDHVLPDTAQLPAEILRQAGFATAGIFRNGWVSPSFGFDQGFDVYTRPQPGPLNAKLEAENPTIRQRGSDEDAIGSALEFLRVRGDKRWFLYLHLMDVHEYVYDDQSALFGGSYTDIYDNAVRRVSDLIGVLTDFLDDMGLADKTLIAIASDHGEAFRERGHEGHARHVDRESTEVPFVLVFPFRLEPGVVVTSRSENIDIWPTLLDLLGLAMPAGADGNSLVPDILAAARGEPSPDGTQTAFAFLDQTWGRRSEAPRPTVAVVEGPLRYVRTEDGGRHHELLFDASTDPAEQHNLTPEDPEDLARLRSEADAYLQKPPMWGEAPRREIGELELNQLRALGYVVP
jgi:arylsulfatase A-like enzyme